MDHARYVTRRIVRHGRSMATGTRSLPTDSPVPIFQPNERGYLLEGSQEDVYATPNMEPPGHTINRVILSSLWRTQRQIGCQPSQV